MSEWQDIVIEELCSEITDCVNKTAPSVDYVTPYKMIRTTNIKQGRINLDEVRYVTEETYKTWIRRGAPQLEDIILTREAPVGEVGMIRTSEKVFLGQRTMMYRADRTKADPYFLYYAFQTEAVQEQIHSAGMGSVVEHVRVPDAKKFKINTPPLPEQKAIASVLSSLDDKIDLLHRQNKTLEAMAETLFRHWFMEEAKEDWEEVPLSDYFKVKHGYAFKGEFITPEPTKYRLVTPGNFEIGGGFKSAKFKYYSSDVIPEEYVFNELDFVVTMTDLSKEGDTLGYPAFIPLHHKADVLYLHNQRVGKVQFYDEKECKFFFYMLMKQDVYQQFIVGSCTGTSVKHTSPTTIGSFTFAKPPQEKIHDFDRIVGQKFAKIFVNQKQIQTLENLRDTLLPKLMSGEVRVQYQTEEVA